jgi:hypothetical protein
MDSGSEQAKNMPSSFVSGEPTFIASYVAHLWILRH